MTRKLNVKTAVLDLRKLITKTAVFRKLIIKTAVLELKKPCQENRHENSLNPSLLDLHVLKKYGTPKTLSFC